MATVRLDRLVRLEAASATADAYGQPIEGWAELGGAGNGTTWANRRAVPAGERRRATQEVAQRAATFVLRWRGDVTAACRLVDTDGTIWDVVAVADMDEVGSIGRGQYLQLDCEIQGTPGTASVPALV